MIEGIEITKSYTIDGRALPVLKPINLKIEPGEFVALQGKSGSGKTSLLSILGGLDRPTSGKVLLNSREIQNLPEEGLVDIRRHLMGFVFQSYHLIPTLNALENILVPAKLAGQENAKERAIALLKETGIFERRFHFPSQLSGGEQQRVSICRALVNSPKIVFADEPTGNLDTKSGAEILQILRGLKGSRSLLVVTHDFEIAAQADRVLEIVDGCLVSR